VNAASPVLQDFLTEVGTLGYSLLLVKRDANR
jgi:hypothetical protein